MNFMAALQASSSKVSQLKQGLVNGFVITFDMMWVNSGL